MAQGGKREGAGRKPGVPNKITMQIKDAILAAAAAAGGAKGMQGYLEQQAKENPNAFMGLLGKVMPTQLTGDGGGPLQVDGLIKVEFVSANTGDDTATDAV